MLEDQETGEMREVNTSSTHLRTHFEAQARHRQEILEKEFLRQGIDLISLRTDRDYLPGLRQC